MCTSSEKVSDGLVEWSKNVEILVIIIIIIVHLSLVKLFIHNIIDPIYRSRINIRAAALLYY